jgi:hypothetical protein
MPSTPFLDSSLRGFSIVRKLGEEVIVEFVVVEVDEVIFVDLVAIVRRFVNAMAVALLPEARGRARLPDTSQTYL